MYNSIAPPMPWLRKGGKTAILPICAEGNKRAQAIDLPLLIDRKRSNSLELISLFFPGDGFVGGFSIHSFVVSPAHNFKCVLRCVYTLSQ